MIQQKWRIVLEELKRRRKMTQNIMLDETRPDRFEGAELVVRFPSITMAEAFAQRGREFAQPIAEAVAQVTGVSCQLRGEGPAGAGIGPAARPTGRAVPPSGRLPAGRPSPPASGSAPGAPPAASPPPVRVGEFPEGYDPFSIDDPSPAPDPAGNASGVRGAASPPTVPARSESGTSDLVHDVVELFDGQILDEYEELQAATPGRPG